MATPVLNNGLLLRETKVKFNTRFIDEYHISNLLADAPPTHIGPVSIWAMARRTESPLYNLSLVSKKNVIDVDNTDGIYTWDLPINNELPQIVEDIEPGNVRKGQYGATFKMKFNTQRFGPGHIITCDNIAGHEVYITDADPVITNDGVIYTCKLASSLDTNSYLDNIFLQPGTVWFVKSSAYGQYDFKFAGTETQTGFRRYFNYISDYCVGRELNITEDAIRKIMSYSGKDAYMDMFEIWQINDSSLYDNSIMTVHDLEKKLGGKKGLYGAVKEGAVNLMLLTKIEAQILSEMQKDIENELMWGRGGRIEVGGDKVVRRQAGLWRQFDFGYKRVYNINDDVIEIIRDVIFNYYAGREPLQGPSPDRVIEVHTGVAGMFLVNEAIKNQALGSGLQINASTGLGIGAIQGKDPMQLSYGFNFTEIILPHYGRIRFIQHPALDNYVVNTITNPKIRGFNLSSYSFLIFDVPDEATNDNILFLRRKDAQPVKWIYQNGTVDYKGSPVVQSSGNFSGYRLMAKQYVPTVHVKDPTRIAKIVMRNPITGDTL